MSQPTCPLIGINADFVPASKQTKAHLRLHNGYFDAVLNAGAVPVVIPPLAKEEQFDAVLDHLDGVILSGGLDMDPKRCAQASHPSVQPMAERRELSDRILIKRIMDRQIPLLAIGLGMQQLNVACGGNLYLHLPEDMPRSMPHREKSDGPHRHAVILESNTRVEEIYGDGELLVNSDHHQAVRQVGTNLRVAARAPDGVIEAIEAVDPGWFCVGVQWHPEASSASALDLQLFECFLQACFRREPAVSLVA